MAVYSRNESVKPSTDWKGLERIPGWIGEVTGVACKLMEKWNQDARYAVTASMAVFLYGNRGVDVFFLL